MTIDDDGIHVDAEDVGRFVRAWEELRSVQPSTKGVMMTFDDAVVHWLPNRVFASDAERTALIDYVTSKIPLGIGSTPSS